MSTSLVKVGELFGGRAHTGQNQVLARPRAGDIAQSPLGLIAVVEFGLVRRVGDTRARGSRNVIQIIQISLKARVVELRGIEPLTSAVRLQRSPI